MIRLYSRTIVFLEKHGKWVAENTKTGKLDSKKFLLILGL